MLGVECSNHSVPTIFFNDLAQSAKVGLFHVWLRGKQGGKHIFPLLIAARRYCEFTLVLAHIRKPNPRRAYARAVNELLTWCDAVGVPDLVADDPAAFCDLDRAADINAGRTTVGETAPGGPATVVRLVGGRPGTAQAPPACGPEAVEEEHFRFWD